MKLGILAIMTLLSHLAFAGEPHLDLRCVNRFTFLPQPPHLGDIQADDSKVVVQVQNVANFGKVQLKDLVAVLDPSVKVEDLKFVEFEMAREKCRTANLNVSVQGIAGTQRTLPTLGCSSSVDKMTPAQIRIHLKDGPKKELQALVDISLHFEGTMSAWVGNTSLDQYLSIRILDPQTTWKELAAIEVLGGGGRVCDSRR